MNAPLHRSPADGGGATRRPLILLALAVAGFGAALWLNRAPSPSLPAPEERPAPAVPTETLARTVDFDAVFGRALWRRRQPDDVIISAERRD
jgi:hypothetical protein